MAGTWDDLVVEVRAQIAVAPDQAYGWLLDRARVLNAEAAWLLVEDDGAPTADPDGRYYQAPADMVWLEAVIAGGVPYQRSTMKALDARWTGDTGNTFGVYAMAPGGLIQIHPATTSDVLLRFVMEVEDVRSGSPPFPSDFDQALVDGAVAMGLARMDERFDSASYFDAKFSSAIERLRRRRHAQIGRGATAIRIVQ